MRRSQFSRAELVALSHAHDTAPEETNAASAALLAQFAEAARLDTANATTEVDTLGRRRIVVIDGERWTLTDEGWLRLSADFHRIHIYAEGGIATLYNVDDPHYAQNLGAAELERFIARCQAALKELRNTPGYVE